MSSLITFSKPKNKTKESVKKNKLVTQYEKS